MSRARRPTDIDADVRARLVVAVRRACPGWLADAADDLVQTAVMKLLRGDVPPPLSDAYLGRVAYTVVIDEIRRRKRRREVGMSPSLPDRLQSSGDVSPEARTRGAEIGQVLVKCLAGLSDERRRAVALYLQDHSTAEIASLLDWDAKKASNQLHRGLGDLRAALARRGVTP